MFAPLRAVRFMLGLAALALVASCSFTRFGYTQADTLAAWMANDYFDLDAQQKDDFQKRFDRLYAWHRYQQLPEYAAFLRTAKGRMQQGLTREDVLWFTDGSRARVRTLARQAAPEAASFLASLQPAQIENLKRHWEKDDKKYLKERAVNGTLDERQQADARRAVKQIKDWLAPITAAQEQQVLALVRQGPDIEQARYAERVRRQKEFLEILSHRGEDRQRFTARVTDWLVNWQGGRSPEYQKLIDAWWQKRAEVFVALFRTFTPQQRTASLERLQRYVDDFTLLAGSGDEGRTASRN